MSDDDEEHVRNLRFGESPNHFFVHHVFQQNLKFRFYHNIFAGCPSDEERCRSMPSSSVEVGRYHIAFMLLRL
jgi:hypothetical protein